MGSWIAILVHLRFSGEPMDTLYKLVHGHATTCLTGLEDGHAGIVCLQINEALALRDDEAQAAGVHQVALGVSRPGLVPVEVLTRHLGFQCRNRRR